MGFALMWRSPAVVFAIGVAVTIGLAAMVVWALLLTGDAETVSDNAPPEPIHTRVPPRTSLPRTRVNKGEMRKCLILIKSTQQGSKDRQRESPEPKNASSSGLSLAFLFNAAAALLLRISGRGRSLSY
jgi:hypothetical protein